jgi:cold shock CspA family protein
MADTFSKKELEKRKQQKKKEKEERKAERKANAKSGTMEDMMAYVDENGNISSKPPDPTKRRDVKEEEIVIGSRNIGGSEAVSARKGKVTYFNTSKGYGFIKDLESQDSIFVHMSSLSTPVKENDFVSFQVENGVKGPTAVSVKKI